MTSKVSLVLLLVFSFVCLCFGQPPSYVVYAPQFNVTVNLFPNHNTTDPQYFPQIIWQLNPQHGKDSYTYQVHLVSIEEGVTNTSSNYFEPYTLTGPGHNTLAQRWAFTEFYNNNNESLSVLLTASHPLYNTPQITGSLTINITVNIKDTKGSTSFRAGDVIISLDKYNWAHNDDDTELAVAYFFFSNSNDFSSESELEIKGENFQLGGGYWGPSNIQTVLGFEQLPTTAKTNPNGERTINVGYLVVDHFDTNSAFIQQTYFGFGSGSSSHAGAIVAVVIILILIVVAAAIIGFVIVRRRRRAYSAL